MASPRKKKMAKYMIDDLLAIAKEQIIRLNPNLEKESILEKMVDERIKQIRKELDLQLKPYKNLLNSVGYLEDVIKHWNNKEVDEYISKKSECIVCTALVTLTDADVKIIKMNEKLLQEKENGSSAN